MNSYFDAVKSEMRNWKKAVLVIVFTVARIIYGWSWLQAGWGKATTEGWLTNGKHNSYGLIAGMVKNMLPPKAHGLDPLHLNSLWAWVATHVFNGMPSLTDKLVICVEIAIGLLMIFGVKLFWTSILALFMNVQFITAGSGNNFGYIWTNIIIMNLANYAELIGVSGYLKYRKGKELLGSKKLTASPAGGIGPRG
ncbi:hypothetical protein CEB3_c40720 [Peptococcaceae bacterium CEB3]|nr:hypothetical protein CEB3_c40720 [Peptococcaceae bacterium CEB3]